MIIQQIPIEKLVPHESSAVKTRVDSFESMNTQPPIVVKPIPKTDLFYIIDGTNRAYRALKNGDTTLACLVATPDFSERLNTITRLRCEMAPGFPLQSLGLASSDNERQDTFFADTDHFLPKVTLRTDRGTMIRVVLDVQYGDLIERHFVLPLKGSIGGLLFEPKKGAALFSAGRMSQPNMSSAWGDQERYDPLVLPSFLELGINGNDVWAAGYPARQAFKLNPSLNPPFSVENRGKVVAVEVTVVYPNGLVYVGPVTLPKEPIAMLWSDDLVRGCNPDLNKDFFSIKPWWQKPTSILFGDSTLTACTIIVHTCGSTCSGGGCLV